MNGKENPHKPRHLAAPSKKERYHYRLIPHIKSTSRYPKYHAVPTLCRASNSSTLQYRFLNKQNLFLQKQKPNVPIFKVWAQS
jgi:hypothetical protein